MKEKRFNELCERVYSADFIATVSICRQLCDALGESRAEVKNGDVALEAARKAWIKKGIEQAQEINLLRQEIDSRQLDT